MPASAAITLDGLRETLGASVPEETIEALRDALTRHGDRPLETIVASPDPIREAVEDGGLQLGETLGQGGMGIVRRATQIALGREVAAKTVRPGRRGDAEVARQLVREAIVTGMLEHPNIVPVHDIGRDEDGMPVVVLKRIEGDAWDELLHDPDRITDRRYARDPLAWHLRVLIQVCHAVELAHDRGVAHRDLKPENVMIGRFGEVYLVDWGVAAALREDVDPRVPRPAAAVVGTPAYMAPEMARAAPDLLSERTDVYLLGAVLYELLTGKPPHEGGSVLEVVANVLLRDPAPPDDAPEELAGICRRAMATAPEDRYARVAELRAAIEDHLEHRASSALVAEGLTRVERLEQLAGADADAQLAELEPARFAFVHALSVWPDNPEARAGLDRALVAMARAELGRGDVGAARSRLTEASRVPAELEAAIEEALAREQKERAILDALEKERREMDPRVGRRQRSAFALFLGAATVFGPILILVRQQLGAPQRVNELLMWPWFMMAFVVAAAWLLRRALLRTKLNRRLMGMLVASMGTLGVFHIGARLAGLSLAVTQSLDFAVFAGLAACIALLVDRRLFVCAVSYTVGFLVATAAPDARAWVLLVTNTIMLANFLWLWPPWRRLEQDEGDVPPSSP